MSSQNQIASVPNAKTGEAHEEAATVVDTIFDVGLAWAEFGVGQGKKALELSAKTLEKAAAALNEIQQRLRKNSS
jgi:hypothetical protein